MFAKNAWILQTASDRDSGRGGRLGTHLQLGLLQIALDYLLVLDIFLVHVSGSTVDDARLWDPVFLLFHAVHRLKALLALVVRFQLHHWVRPILS